MPGSVNRLAWAVWLIFNLAAQPSSETPREPSESPWRAILESAGLWPARAEDTPVFFVFPGEAPPPDWTERVERGGWLVLEGESATAESLGFRPSGARIRVASVVEARAPDLEIVWASAVETRRFDVPAQARVFTRERWSGAPLVAGFRRGAGGVLWVAVSPGERGFERFPFLLHALGDLGLQPLFRSNRLWAFLDSSYRTRADSGYLAERWRAAGIGGLHVAAWHFHEPDAERDRYLRELIDACHRRGIQVYAWLELPHVSEEFWRDHPEWREKTAQLQDAHLDWRKLMNLANPECFAAAAQGVSEMLRRFEWDGVNLAELYFESLQGHATPSRFTPMNVDVRREFQRRHGFDPLELFDGASPRNLRENAAGLRQFLDFRAELAHRLQAQWIETLEELRQEKPHLALVLTHIDDQFDPGMRDALGADAKSLLTLLPRHDFTFLIEDPATVWNLGAERYSEIARRYNALTEHRDRLAIDVNIVERYQDVYPTKQQAGIELFQLVQHAAQAFPRVALYAENSIRAEDVPWLSAAAAGVVSWRRDGGRLIVESRFGTGVRWKGPALVDGMLWPVASPDTVWLPPGRHTIEGAAMAPPVCVTGLSGEVLGAGTRGGGIELVYRGNGRTLAALDRRPASIWLDGKRVSMHEVVRMDDSYVLLLPGGEHTLRLDAGD